MITLIRREFVVECSLEQAFSHLAQVERWPSWAKHIQRVELEPAGELTAKSRGTFRLAGGVTSTFRMEEFDPPRRWRWVGPFLWLRIDYDHLFEAVDAGRTRLTWIVRADGVAVGLVGRVFAAIYRRNLERAVPGLVAEMNALA
jgi:hypothetical protein